MSSGSRRHSRPGRNPEQLTQWVDDYAERLYRAAALATCADDAGDLCQDVFLVAARSGETFSGQSTPYTWLYAILRNLIRDRRRKFARRAGAVPIDRPPRAISPEQDVGRREEHLRVRQAVARLPEGHREVVSLFYLEELSVAEVAERLNQPVGTVKSRLFNARTTLKRVLEGSGAD